MSKKKSGSTGCGCLVILLIIVIVCIVYTINKNNQDVKKEVSSTTYATKEQHDILQKQSVSTTQQSKPLSKVYFDIPKLLIMNMANIKKNLGKPQNEFVPTTVQLNQDPEFPFTATYVKNNVTIQFDYIKTGLVKSIFISCKSKGSTAEDIMELGNLQKQNSTYQIRIQNWLSPTKARANGESEIAGIEVTPLY